MRFFKHVIMAIFSLVFILSAINCENKTEPIVQPGDPALGVSPTSLTLSGSPIIDELTIYNTGGGQVEWNISAAPAWLTVLPVSGQVKRDSATVRLTTEFEELDYGEYSGVVTISSNAGKVDVSVSLSYSAPQLQVSTTILNLDRHYSYGDLMIENLGGGALEWQITESPAWLEFEVLSDIVYGQPQAVPFRVHFTGVEYGDYVDTVRVESSAGAAVITTYLSYFREEEVIPGTGAANIALGDAYNKVKKILGNPDRNWYERPSKTVFIHYFIYQDLGLLFYVQNNSPILYGTGPVGYIKLMAPYDGYVVGTQVGIGSTRADVVAALGEPTSVDSNLNSYDTGITFEIVNEVVTAMIIQ